MRIIDAWKHEIGGPDVLDYVNGLGETGGALIDEVDYLQFTGSGHTNDGQIALAGGTVEFSGTLTNQAGGDILGRGVLVTDSLTNSAVSDPRPFPRPGWSKALDRAALAALAQWPH